MIKPDWSFQDDAIKKLISEFKKNPYSKNLLVIPTGGGKTIVALKIISKLIEDGFIKYGEYVIWATHLKQLKKQTEDKSLEGKKYQFNTKIKRYLEIEMKDAARRKIRNDKNHKYKLLVIDEAHHSAANGYKEFFNKKIGILGLTATPTRTDEVKLDFDRTAYEITFNELIKRNVIIKPKFVRVNTGEIIDVKSLDSSEEEMDKFNNKSRNQKIANVIFDNKDKYKKIVIFVGSKKHIKDLYEVIKIENEFRGKPYEHIGYIFGEDNKEDSNEKGIENNTYLKWQKKLKSSILVNCEVLSEGYDDPILKTVVMAVPTKSSLRYIQCIGRVVRNPLDQGEHDVYVIEMFDDLPNINYRIDNKWLFADVSEYLEPIILEEEYYDKKSLKEKLNEIFRAHNIEKKYIRKFDSIKDTEYFRILLFTANAHVGSNSKWKPILITEGNKNYYLQIFNKLSNNIDKFYKKNSSYVCEKLGIKNNDGYFKEHSFKADFLAALNMAYLEINKKAKVERLKYIILNKIEKYPEGFLEFIENCYNKEQIKEEFNKGIDKKYIVLFPLILGEYEGRILNEDEFKFCLDFINSLKDIKKNKHREEHEASINSLMSSLESVPIPLKYLNSMICIVRNDISNFYFKINGE